MFVCEEAQFVYFGNPKAASSKIIEVLRKYFRLEGHANWTENYFPSTPHHSMILPEKYKNYFKFTSVRNPYTRELSKFNFRPKLNRQIYEPIIQNISEYLDWICDRKLTGNWVTDYWKLTQEELIFKHPVPVDCVPVSVDFIVRVENLAGDLRSIFDKIPAEEWATKANENKNYKQSYFPLDKQDMFYESFRQDFQRFEYPYRLPRHLIEVKHL